MLTSHVDATPLPIMPAVTLPAANQAESTDSHRESQLNKHQRFLAVYNLGMQCWKSLLNMVPPRPRSQTESTPTQLGSLRNSNVSRHSQSEVRELELRCICPFIHKDGILVHCWRCAKSQHAVCYYPNNPAGTSDGISASHQCLHCETVRGDTQDVCILDFATVRRAGYALRTWCGDVEELSGMGTLGDREYWENAGMLLVLLVRLIASSSYAAGRCGEATVARMKYHSDVVMIHMLGLDTTGQDSSHDSDANVEICLEEDFAKTAMSLVQGLMELLPGLVDQ